jgi:hypothetical protein
MAFDRPRPLCRRTVRAVVGFMANAQTAMVQELAMAWGSHARHISRYACST